MFQWNCGVSTNRILLSKGCSLSSASVHVNILNNGYDGCFSAPPVMALRGFRCCRPRRVSPPLDNRAYYLYLLEDTDVYSPKWRATELTRQQADLHRIRVLQLRASGIHSTSMRILTYLAPNPSTETPWMVILMSPRAKRSSGES
jgi:hypothetical protein